MDLLEHQRRRKKRGLAIVALSVICLANAIRISGMLQVPAVAFLTIYASGISLGVGVAIIVASYKVKREIESSK